MLWRRNFVNIRKGRIFICASNWIEEIDAYIKESGYTYRTTGDHTPELRNRIIQAFHELY